MGPAGNKNLYGRAANGRAPRRGSMNRENHLNLMQYLNRHLGEPIGKLAVISAVGTPGFVQKVEWNHFPSTCELLHEIDIEKSWVTILWENGKDSVDSVDNMIHIGVKENSEETQ